VLGYLARTPTSLAEHGENATMTWAPNGRKIVIQTTQPFLVLVTVEIDTDEVLYQSPVLASNAQRHFLSGPGEALPLHAIGLHLEGVIRLEGTLLSVSPRNNFILFSTQGPPTVQHVPWPGMQHSEDDYATWILNDEEFPWLIDSDVTVSKILHLKSTASEVWITSDGRAYLVQLHHEDEHHRKSVSSMDGQSYEVNG